MRAARRHGDGTDELHDCEVLIQGVGGVGAPLARLCAKAGARLLVTDADAERERRMAGELGARQVPADEVYQTPCDIFAPCAVGAILNRESIPRLRCRIVAGAANNQLAEADDAELLQRRDILYAPDYVINAGGALAFGLRGRGEQDDDVLSQRVRGLDRTLTEVFVEAREQGESPVHAARRRVRRVLERGRS